MRSVWTKLMAAVLALTMLIGLMPEMLGGVETAFAVGSYGMTTEDAVNVRTKPATSGDYWFRVPKGWVCTVLDTTKSGNVTWYKVQVTDPESSTGRKITGYVHGGFFRMLTDEEAAAWEKNPVQTALPNFTPPPGYTTGAALGEVTNSGTNFREGPSTKSYSMFKLDRGTVVELLSIPAAGDTDPWYHVRYDGKTGYIMGPYIRVIYSGATPTPVPTVNPSATPTTAPTATPVPVTGYVKTIKSNVNLRDKPDGDTKKQVPKNVVLAFSDRKTEGKYSWYCVKYSNYTGYLRSDCVVECDEKGNPVKNTATPSAAPQTATPAPTGDVTAVPTSVPTATPAPTVGYGYIKTIVKSVNLRTKPAGRSQEQIAINVVLPVIGPTEKNGSYVWYPVHANSGRNGYLRGDCVVPCDAQGNAINTTPTPVITPDPSASPTATPVVTATPGPVGETYIKTIVGAVNFRKTTSGSVVDRVDKDVAFMVTGATLRVSGYTWYPVVYRGVSGYLRSDVVTVITEEEYRALNGGGTPAPVPTATVTPGDSGHVITIQKGVNLRKSSSKDSDAKYQVPMGTVMAFTTKRVSGGSTWYQVTYSGTSVWVLGSCVREMTEEEYNQYIGVTTPTPMAPLGYVKTTASGLNVREKVNGTKIIGRVEQLGTQLPYFAKQVEGNVTWYYVQTSFGMGYVNGKYVTDMSTPDVTPVPTAGPSDDPTVTTPPPTETPGLVYPTLKLGSTGEAVTKLVTALKDKGYYKGSITSTYTSAVQSAVKAFQKANGLAVDGIAGNDTQVALYGGAPVNPGDLSMTLYAAEKIDWYTGGIDEMWPRGSNFKIYDVKTGVVWWAHRWAGGSHADIEPLTAADTGRLCMIYGVNTAKEIDTKNLWQRRPCLVTIGNRTFACSLYGVPHGTQTIMDNNFPGQACLHFTNSKTHKTERVDSYHKEAIQYAWEHAPNGHK